MSLISAIISFSLFVNWSSGGPNQHSDFIWAIFWGVLTVGFALKEGISMWFKHREKMEMLRRGISVPVPYDNDDGWFDWF